MAKYASNDQKNFKIGISSFSDNKTSLEVIGRVGINSSSAKSALDVAGSVNVSDGLSVGSTSTFKNTVYLENYNKLKFGLSESTPDLEIYHDSSRNSYIDSNTLNLIIRNNVDNAGTRGDIVLQAKSGDDSAKFVDEGQVELYYNNSKKFETTGYGVTISGGLIVSGVLTATSFTGAGTGLTGITSATNATNIYGGATGQILYQAEPGITSAFESGSTGLVLHSRGSGQPPEWRAATPSGVLEGLLVFDEGSPVGGGVTYSGLDFRGQTIAITGANNGGIATVTLSKQTFVAKAGISTSVVGGAASVAQLNVDVGISTFADFKITSSGVGATVGASAGITTYYGRGTELTGIVTSITAGANITINNSSGNVTISGIADTSVLAANSIYVTGITTLNTVEATSLDVSGITTLNTTTVTTLTVSNDATFNSNVTIDGQLTYDDVTNVDSIGFVTARKGLNVGSISEINVTILADGDAKFNGIVTANKFVGDGSELVNLPGGGGGAPGVSQIAVTDESSDTTCFPVFATQAIGNVPPKTGTNLTFNSSDGTLTAVAFSGSGANLTNLTSGNLSGALPAIDGSALTNLPGGGSGAPGVTQIAVTDESSDTTCFPVFATEATGNISPKTGTNLTFDSNDGTLTAVAFSGSGESLASLNASNLGSGTIPDARFPATLPTVSGANLTSLNASNLGSGTIPDARFPATLPTVSGANLTNLTSGNLSGALPAIDGSALTNLPGGGSGAPGVSQIAVTDESTDTTCFPLFATEATGNISPKTGTNLTFDSNTGTLTAVAFSGSGESLASLNASNLGSGTIPDARFPATLPTVSGVNLTNLTSGNLSGDLPAISGTNLTNLTSGNLVGALPAIDGSALTNLPGGGGGAPGVSQIAVTDESTDTTCFPVFAIQATGNISPKTGTNLTFNSSDGTLTAVAFSGSGASLINLTSGNLSGALPAISGANLTNLTSGNLVGALPAISGANLTNLTSGNLSGALPAISGANLTNLTSGNLSGALPAIDGSALTNLPGSGGGAPGVVQIAVTDESSDTTCFPVFATQDTGNISPKTGTNLTFDSNTGTLTAVAFSGSGASLTNLPSGGDKFNIGITTSVYVSITGGIGTASIEANNDIFIGPGIATQFPSTAGKSYIIESIHVTNIYNANLYLTSRHDFNGGQNVPTTQRVVVPYQGSLELLEEPIIAKPSDILSFQAFVGVGTTATGVNNGLDSFIIYSEKTDTDYIGTGVTVSTPAGTEMFTSNTNPSVIQSIRLCNYDLNIDVDASVSIYRGGSVGGILTTGVRQGYLVYNMTVPKNSVIEILERPKYLAANDTIVVGIAGTTLTDSLSATLSGKYIT